MLKQINVITSDGTNMEPTYPKRAKQLVRLNKAAWVNDSTICLSKNKTECVIVDYNSNEPQSSSKLEDYKESFPRTELKDAVPIYESHYTDQELYKMARKKIKQKSGLIVHAIAYISVNIFLLFIAFSDGELWNMYVLGGWGIGLACHMATYFFSASPERIHQEYLKQKSKLRI